jgi:hypothetical protein
MARFLFSDCDRNWLLFICPFVNKNEQISYVRYLFFIWAPTSGSGFHICRKLCRPEGFS